MKPCVACAEEIQNAAKLCKHCGTHQIAAGFGKDVPAEVQGPHPSEGPTADPSAGSTAGGGCLKPALWILGIILVLSVIFGSFSGGTGGAGAAKVACHNRVESALKAPSTARFSSTVSKHNTREDDFLVEGTVDAQNSFGATVRSSFQCVVDTSGSSPRVTLNYLG